MPHNYTIKSPRGGNQGRRRWFKSDGEEGGGTCLIALLGVQWAFSLSMGVCDLYSLPCHLFTYTLARVGFLSPEFSLLFLLIAKEFVDRAGNFSPENSLREI